MTRTRIALTLCCIALTTGAQAGVIVVAKTSPLVPMSTEEARRVFLGLQR